MHHGKTGIFNMSPVLDNLQSACHRIRKANEDAREALHDLATHGRNSENIGVALTKVGANLEDAITAVAKIQEEFGQDIYAFFGGKLLSREQFHLMSGIGIINYSNKCVGLSQYDDYEVFRLFHVESASFTGYMDLDPPEVDDPPTTANGMRTITARVGIGGRFSKPEKINWLDLRDDQRRFFAKSLPDIAARFRR